MSQKQLSADPELWQPMTHEGKVSALRKEVPFRPQLNEQSERKLPVLG
jgi:hypothetical protein